MQHALASRVAAAPAAFKSGSKNCRRQRQQLRRQQLAPLAVAAIEEPAAAEAGEAGDGDLEWDREAAYARFEALLDQHTFSYQTGDKVCGGTAPIIGALASMQGAWRPAAASSCASIPVSEPVAWLVAAGARHRGAGRSSWRIRRYRRQGYRLLPHR